MKYIILINNQIESLPLVHSEAVKELMYRIKEYNDVIKEINDTVNYQYRKPLERCNNQNNEVLRYESEIDIFTIEKIE